MNSRGTEGKENFVIDNSCPWRGVKTFPSVPKELHKASSMTLHLTLRIKNCNLSTLSSSFLIKCFNF